jgi:hypothetical protein
MSSALSAVVRRLLQGVASPPHALVWIWLERISFALPLSTDARTTWTASGYKKLINTIWLGRSIIKNSWAV